MHTSVEPPIGTDAVLEYTGTVLHRAEARTNMLDNAGHTVPVLCFELELDTPLHNSMLVEQPFPAGEFDQCRAAARRMKVGSRVSVQAPLVGVRIVARNATHIHIIKEPQEQAA